MKIPKDLKINGIIYDIIEVEPKDGKLEKIRNWAEIDFEESKIYINKKLNNARKCKVLFHEAARF
jgi:hypothetical protein